MKQSTLGFTADTASTSSTAKQKRVINLVSDDDEESDGDTPTKKARTGGLSNSSGTEAVDVKVSEVKRASSEPSSSQRQSIHTNSSADALHIPELPFSIQDVLPPVEPRVIRKDAHDLDLLYFKGFVGGERRKEFFDYLRSALPFYRVRYTVRGIHINTPRFTTVFGCDETGAKPSAYKIAPRALPKVLHELKSWVEQRTGHKYNFVLVNYYQDGNDSISWHSDDEHFLAANPCIASLSLGGSRDFALKHKKDKAVPQEKFHLASGDMVVMFVQSCP